MAAKNRIFGRTMTAAAAVLGFALALPAAAQASGLEPSALVPLGGGIKPSYGNIGPFYGNIGPFYGNIGPFYGNIGPFYGNIGPFYGNIGPFYGNIGPFYGNIGPFYGNIGPFYGNIGPFEGGYISPFYGNIGPFWGEMNPFYGNIGPFYGNIGPFYGNIGPFYGNIGPFYGNIGPFYGNIGPFWGDLDPSYGNIGPFYGNIGPFYGQIGPFWENTGELFIDIQTAWAVANDPAGLSGVRDQLQAAITESRTAWGDLVAERSGSSFDAAFLNPLLAKYGINLDDPSTLAALTAEQRALLFLDWYDGLMDYSGADRPDWWMRVVNWSPSITQAQQTGNPTKIGLIDVVVTDADIQSKIISTGGYTTFSNPHSSAVASLAVGSHDGYGVMGIAPNARLATYSPFDATGTADWSDVRAGIVSVSAAGANVVNLSLGVPGTVFPVDWQTQVFGQANVAALKNKTVYVIAAGNDGIAQNANVAKTAAANGTNFLLVGSIDPIGNLSFFSNRPGTGCLTTGNTCANGDRFMDRFIVAPGEMLLASDGAGGTTRVSGTSYAAPLVTGAIALLHDRWPWLKNYPAETVGIITKSATDLGDPGTDAIYGVGALNVSASQAPLNFNNLTFYEYNGGTVTSRKAQDVRRDGVKASWETDGIYFTAFEKLGRTQRDFIIPLSSRFVGLNAPNSTRRFQDYIYGRLVDWITKGGTSGFNETAQSVAFIPNSQGLTLSMTAGVSNPMVMRYSRDGNHIQSSLRLASSSNRIGLTVGQGDGAIALGRQAGFGMFSDHDSETGGVNPVLGFASGGAYASVDVAVTPRLSLSVGATRQDRSRDLDLLDVNTVEQRTALVGLKAYEAAATHATLGYQLSGNVRLTASYTALNEDTGLLGIRSIEASDLRGGSRTESLSVGADVDMGAGFRLAASATRSQTRTDRAAALSTTDGGLIGSAYQVALSKAHVFGKNDQVRLSFAQPLTVERGQIEYMSVQVIDRETGELGYVGQRFDIASTGRRYVAEALYGLSLMDDTLQLNAFGRGELGDVRSDTPRYTVGAGARFRF